MTIIAYRAGVMAADTLITQGDIKTKQVIKIVKADGFLGGAAGQLNHCAQFLEWVKSGRDFNNIPKYDNYSGVLVSPERKIFWIADGIAMDYQDEYVTEGSGSAYALGAFSVGATAEQAVQAAMKHSATCGGDLTVLRLD